MLLKSYCSALVLVFIPLLAQAKVLQITQLPYYTRANHTSYLVSCQDGSQKRIHESFVDKKAYDDLGVLIKYAYGIREAADMVCKTKVGG